MKTAVATTAVIGSFVEVGLAINLKTARSIGLTLPPKFLAVAGEAIE